MSRLVIAVAATFAFIASPSRAEDAMPPAMKTLATGSRIAIWTIPASAKPRKTLVLYLHGGPGMYTTQDARDKGTALRAVGFTTVYFDQAGGGLSDRLPAAQYTLRRAVDDVEAIRIALKADKIVLWGNSYGASLATLYARRFPDRVAALILSSPGGFPGTEVKRNYGLTNRGNVTIGAALTKAMRVIDKRGAAAEADVSQAQAGKLMDELVTTELMDGMVCKGTSLAPEAGGGGNLFPNRLLAKEMKAMPIPQGAPLGRPVLILRGSCDFLSMENAERYRSELGGSIVSVPNTGHQFVENRAGVDAALTRFAATELAGVE